MNNDKILSRLKSEIEDVTPDVFDKIKDEISKNSSSATVITFSQRKRFSYKSAVSVAAVLAVIIMSSLFFLSPSSPALRVEFDVNPGIVLEVDKNERVSDVELLNKEAEIVLDSMNLKGIDLNVAVNALMYSIIKHGYIDEMRNSVLVTLSNSNGIDKSKFEKEISENVNSALKECSIEGSVMVHSMDENKELEALAEKYSITVGKAGLIEQLISSGKTVYTFDQLSKLSINELNILMNEHDAFHNIQVMGSASRKAYISEENAEKIAYAAFEATEKDVKPIDCMLELDSGIMVYEVEFILNGALYECEVDALTGKVTECDIELAKDKNGSFEIPTTEPAVTSPSEATSTDIETTTASATENKNNFIGNEKAKSIAFSHLGVSESDVKELQVEFDYHGTLVYCVEFVYKNLEYEYEINAETGEIVEFETDD